MHITKVITYKGAWQTLIEHYQEELNEMQDAIQESVAEYLRKKTTQGNPNSFFSMRGEWELALKKRGWLLYDDIKSRNFNKNINTRSIGAIKNALSATTPLNLDFFTRWLFNSSALAVKNDVIKLPILVVPSKETQTKLGKPIYNRDYFEIYENQLKSLAPLNISYPFLIIGYSDEPVELQLIEVETNFFGQEKAKVIDKSIEFPPEYHLAGLNILNFFGTYLREQYPDEDAKVKIEQDGLIVRLIVESKDGKSEIVEKALHEYEMIVKGEQRPEEIINNDKLVLELKNELRFAIHRIETQKELLAMERGRNEDLRSDVKHLMDILGAGLVNKNPVIIDFKPSITTTSVAYLQEDLSRILGDLNQLKAILPTDDPAHIALIELEGPLISIQREPNPDIVKNSTVMAKFKDFIDKVSEGNDTIEKSIKATKKGWELFQELAGNYNKVAQWCGLPQVPTIFTK